MPVLVSALQALVSVAAINNQHAQVGADGCGEAFRACICGQAGVTWSELWVTLRGSCGSGFLDLSNGPVWRQVARDAFGGSRGNCARARRVGCISSDSAPSPSAAAPEHARSSLPAVPTAAVLLLRPTSPHRVGLPTRVRSTQWESNVTLSQSCSVTGMLSIGTPYVAHGAYS